jgi:uncharacterized protein YciI
MQFLVLARDGTDAEAPARRQKFREAHLAGAFKLHDSGNILIGGAILDEQGGMIGSAIITDFPDRAALDAWLKNDPYVTGNVWQHIEVKPFRAATSKAKP